MNLAVHLNGLGRGEATLVSLGVVCLAIAAGLLAYSLAFRFLQRLAKRTESLFDDVLVQRWRGPARLFLPLLFLLLAAPMLRLPPEVLDLFRHLLGLGFIAAVAWLLIGSTLALRDIVLSRYDVQTADNLKARTVQTQLNVLVKIVLVIIVLVAAASMLMTFERIRQVGVSLLASAGLVGVIAGFAAQRSLGTLFAGIQIAITQPIRLDDVVIVEGEWGRIEEITLTYVVVRIWDLRRLIVPITCFLEKPFQNWTRVSADILGTVYLYTDYGVPVDEVRAELERLLAASPLWDGKVAGLQVTNATERVLELRALMGARDSSAAWDLRCEVREKLIDFIRRRFPEALPRLRAELEQAPDLADGAGDRTGKATSL
ncbi:MAG TPA: mechanosensitive ion channel family protein [Desulfuromonadales bacterium]|nr:mechanosensitive ion channel family protein [Desulfuromonadales bacterium]